MSLSILFSQKMFVIELSTFTLPSKRSPLGWPWIVVRAQIREKGGRT